MMIIGEGGEERREMIKLTSTTIPVTANTLDGGDSFGTNR